MPNVKSIYLRNASVSSYISGNPSEFLPIDAILIRVYQFRHYNRINRYYCIDCKVYIVSHFIDTTIIEYS